ncbi:hypothetical protein N9Y92_04185, partial [Chlamydiales bacterium]|nr:hypothetical protein [Chlamydiales bacterium]
YEISDLSPYIPLNHSWNIRGVTDNGQVYGSYYTNDNRSNGFYIYDSKKNIPTIVESKDKNHQFIPLKVTNFGEVFVAEYNPMHLFSWEKFTGIHPVEICDSEYVDISSINDLGQMIGNHRYDSKSSYSPFLWDNGKLTNMGIGSKLYDQLESLGYTVTDINLFDFNNKGELCGNFTYGKFNKIKKELVNVGKKFFFWNGTPHIIPLDIFYFHQFFTARINNNGKILITVTDVDYINNDVIELPPLSYLWSFEDGLQPLDDFIGNSINDSSVVLGYRKEYTYASNFREIPGIYKNGEFLSLASMLGVTDLNSLAPPFSDEYEIERIHTIVNINNRGQIACMGIIWGETVPCILNPTNND